MLDALLAAARASGVTLWTGRRVARVARTPAGFVAAGPWGEWAAPRLILAAGGKALPKSGSDGHGYALAQALGHTLTPAIFPALVPLALPRDHFLCALSGISSDVALTVQTGNGKPLARIEGALLCTHFGVSGPAVLDISRHWLAVQARPADQGQRPVDERQRPSDGVEGVSLLVNWLPGVAGAGPSGAAGGRDALPA